MKLKNLWGISVGKHCHACYGTPHCSESSQRAELAKSSETNKLLQKEVWHLSSKIFQRGFYPQFFFPSHDLEEPEEVVLFGLIQLSHERHQLPQMGRYRLRLLLVERGQDTQQHRVPQNGANERPVTHCMSVSHSERETQKVSRHLETPVFKNHQYKYRET